MNNTNTIRYIKLPEGSEKLIEGFKLDSSIKIPIQLKDSELTLDPEAITLEAIVAGMLVVMAYERDHKDFEYFKNFVLSVEPMTIEQLHTAAIAKEKQKDFPFAEQLFLTVYNMLKSPDSCINLAKLYSSWAINSKENEDAYIKKAIDILKDGIKVCEDKVKLYSELGSYYAYLSNFDAAVKYLKLYLDNAEEKDQLYQDMYNDITNKLGQEERLEKAYDFMMLEESAKALVEINKYLEISPKAWNAHFLKGWALRTMEKYEEATACFVESIRLDNTPKAIIYNELSICALNTGNKELAIDYLSIAVDIEENISDLSNLGFLYIMQEDYDSAKYYLEKARAIDQNDPALLAIMQKYTEETGEEFGPVIIEEIVKSEDDKKDEHEHDHEHDCCCGHEHHHQHDCSCGHDPEGEDDDIF